MAAMELAHDGVGAETADLLCQLKQGLLSPELGPKKEPAAAKSAGLNGWGGLGGNMPSLNDLLLSASAGGNVLDVEALLSKGADAFYQRTSDGVSSLMLAAKGGHAKVVDMLLLAGAPWNALDRSGKCAGEYALAAGNQNLVDVLVNAGVRAELLLRTLERTLKEQRAKAVNDEEAAKKVVEKKCAVNGNPKDCPSANSDLYLTRNVRYENGKLMDSENDAVMMEWEKPLMVAHAQVLCVNANAATQESSGSATTESSSAASSGGESAAAADLFMNAVKPLNVLNVGYGMGIFDRAVQEWKPTTHTIIEAHPQVYARMIEEGWNKKEGVTVLFGRWQDVIPKLPLKHYDAIFFDTYGEYYADMQHFHNFLPQLLSANGRYSFFNGLCPGNIFFHGVICQIVQLELAQLGLGVQFIPCEIDSSVTAPDGSSTWNGVKRRYWHFDTYYLPLCYLENTQAASSTSDVTMTNAENSEEKVAA